MDRQINVSTIKNLTELMFCNLKIAMDTSDWNAEICGAPAWRYIYHTIHSCDKFFINPSVYDEPPFQTPKLDWPDTPSKVVLDRYTLYGYYQQVKEKILKYVENLTDEKLTEIPNGCSNTRLGLIMEQFRHMYAHVGILNGITIANTGKYPRVLNISDYLSGEHRGDLYDDDVR